MKKTGKKMFGYGFIKQLELKNKYSSKMNCFLCSSK